MSMHHWVGCIHPLMFILASMEALFLVLQEDPCDWHCLSTQASEAVLCTTYTAPSKAVTQWLLSTMLLYHPSWMACGLPRCCLVLSVLLTGRAPGCTQQQ